MGFWGTATRTCLRSQWDYSLINMYPRVMMFMFIRSTRKNWLDKQGRMIHSMPLVLFSWTFLLDPEWPLTLGCEPGRWNYPEEIEPPHLWLPLTPICVLQRETTAIMSLFSASAIKACRGKWREIRAGERTEDWIGQSIVVKLFVFLCQDKREINRRYWCWALGSLVSLLLCHLSLSLYLSE